MYSIIVGLIIFVSVLLIIVVLVQNSKGGGLSSQFGGNSSNQFMGVQKTNDLLLHPIPLLDSPTNTPFPLNFSPSSLTE